MYPHPLLLELFFFPAKTKTFTAQKNQNFVNKRKKCLLKNMEKLNLNKQTFLSFYFFLNKCPWKIKVTHDP